MEELCSMWNYQEDFEQMKLRLQVATTELESLKMETNEEKSKHIEDIMHLRCLIKLVYKERDEAREQLRMLINKLIPQSENPMLIAPKANSSITESNSLPDAYCHHHSHGHGCSSPLDSFFFDTVTSPGFSTMKIAADSAAAVIGDLAKGTTLPQKGNLLQAVLEAGPLLQTLIVAGPLPRWRNPPPLQAFKIPASSLKLPCEMSVNPNRSLDEKRGIPFSASMLSFAGSEMLNTGPITPVKHQKFFTS